MDEITLKILLLGDSSVGKSSLMLRFTDNTFEENFGSTIGAEFKNKDIQINDEKIKLHILDTAGQERYRSVAKNFIRKVGGIIFVFDLSNNNSFENIKDWLMTADDANNNYQKILVGNKLDIPERKIDKERAEKLGEKYNMKYFETSAKEGTNVELIFKEIAELIISNKPEKEDNNNTSILSNQSNNSKKHCCKNK